MMSTPLLGVQPVALVLAAAIPTALWLVDAVLIRRRLAVARRDPLTGLHSRDGYTRCAAKILNRYEEQSLIVFLDMTGFKLINDRYGHDAGNAVLAATGRRLRAWAGTHGVAARIHGDEFAAAVPIPAHRRNIRLTQLHQLLHQPVLFEGTLIDPGVSIGAAGPLDLNSRDLAVLLRGADAAMYEHKQGKTGTYRVATPAHATTPTVNGRRLGRPGTITPGTRISAS